jgi:hypothetical protein
MTQYAILIYGDESALADAGPEAMGSMLDAHRAFAKQVGEIGGTLLGGAGLGPTATATSIRDGMVTDGPFADTKEAFGGYYVLEARDLDHALEIAKLCPAPSGGVEVRPVLESSVVEGRR